MTQWLDHLIILARSMAPVSIQTVKWPRLGLPHKNYLFGVLVVFIDEVGICIEERKVVGVENRIGC